MTVSSGRPITIVMIEDDEGHARLIEKNIRRAGICNRIVAFRLGGEAMAWLMNGGLAHGSGLVMLDLNLPDIGGVEILRKIKTDPQLRRLPVVVLTTDDDQREIQRCYDLGCNVYVTKPVEYESFAAAIRKLGLFLEVIELPPVDPPDRGGRVKGTRP